MSKRPLQTKRKAASGLPPVVPGQPFCLIDTLRRTRKLLTIEDVAILFNCSKKKAYADYKAGRIPPAHTLPGLMRVDPQALLFIVLDDNKHLLPSTRALKAA